MEEITRDIAAVRLGVIKGHLDNEAVSWKDQSGFLSKLGCYGCWLSGRRSLKKTTCSYIPIGLKIHVDFFLNFRHLLWLLFQTRADWNNRFKNWINKKMFRTLLWS